MKLYCFGVLVVVLFSLDGDFIGDDFSVLSSDFLGVLGLVGVVLVVVVSFGSFLSSMMKELLVERERKKNDGLDSFDGV